MKTIEVTHEDLVDDDYRIGVKLPDGKTFDLLIPGPESYEYDLMSEEKDYGLNISFEGHYI